jgi:hypothetical protein
MGRRLVYRPCYGRGYLILVLLAVLLIPLPGCGSGSSSSTLITRDGTVRFVLLEGGFYGIVGDDSVRYEPTNLTSEFQQDGLRVHFFARAVSGLSAHQWGRLVEIVSISKL